MVSLPSHADELSDLKAQIQLLNSRLDAMQARQTATAAETAAAPAEAKPAPLALTTDQNGTPIEQSSSPAVAATVAPPASRPRTSVATAWVSMPITR